MLFYFCPQVEESRIQMAASISCEIMRSRALHAKKNKKKGKRETSVMVGAEVL